MAPAHGSPNEADESEDEASHVPWVIVTAEPKLRNSPSESSVDRRDIDAIGARSAQDILRSLSGIQLSQHGSEGKAAQFFLRGFDAVHGRDITIGVDGFPLNEPSHVHGHGYADTGLLIPEALRAVTLRKGPFDLGQGNLSTAGDINYELGVPEPLRGTALGVEAGRPWRGRVWAYDAPTGSDVGDVVAGEVVVDQGPFENRQTRRAGIVGQRRHGDWSVRAAVQAAQFGLPGALPNSDLEAGRMGRDETYTPHTGGQSGQAWLGAVHETSGGAHSHRTSLDIRGRQFDGRENFTGYLFDAEYGDEQREYQRGVMVALAHRTRWRISERFTGLLYAGVAVDRMRQFVEAVDSSGLSLERQLGGRGWQGTAHIAPGLSGFLGERLEVEGGVRLEALAFDYRDEASSEGQGGQKALAVVLPRGRASLFAGQRWTISAAAGRGYRGPQARAAVTDSDGEPDRDLRQQRADTGETTVVDAAEVGLIFNPRPIWELSLTGFAYHSDAEFIFDHLSRSDIDLGATRRHGAELAGAVGLGRSWRLRGHATVVDAEFTDDQKPIPYAPRIEGGVMGHRQFSQGLFTGAQWRAVGRRALPFGAEARAWSLLDAHLGWAGDGWTFRLHIDNILDATWAEGVYHYASHFDRSQPVSGLPAIHQVPGHPRMVRVQLSHRW